MTREWLPSVLFEMRARFGADLATRFCQEFGGGRIHVPKKANPDDKVARSYGMEVAEWLVAAYGGISLEVPLASASVYRSYTAAVDAMVAAGATETEIIRRLRVHRRTVYRRRAARRDRRTDQGDLFD